LSTKNVSSNSLGYWEKTNSENISCNENKKPINLQMALKYKQLGFPVISVHYRSKVAAVKWEPYQNKISTRDEIQGWFSNTNHNIAIVLGRISSSFELDIDGEEGKKCLEEKLS
jgi:Bifunctional DNA primase/polymerase, N-terminal